MGIVWWIKRDLRLADNESLSQACKRAKTQGGEVLPVYLLEPSLLSAPETGALHLHVVTHALGRLRSRLRKAGAELLLLRGDAPAAFEELKEHFPFQGIYAEEETGTRITYDRDLRVRTWCAEKGVEFREVPRNGVIRRLGNRDRRMSIWRDRMRRELIAEPSTVPLSAELRRFAAKSVIPTLGELSLPAFSGAVQRVDEKAAERTLESFLTTRGKEYSRGISSPTLSRFTGSRLSVHLAWGTLSLRQVFQKLESRVEELRQNPSIKGWLRPLSSFRTRLFWHDHFCQRLEDEPEMEFHTLNRAFEEVPYNGPEEFGVRLWQGRTGFPMVDAAVRSLTEAGFVNFRMRAMIVSFATYALHLDWRDILHPMARIMADYLPGIHISQLQMQAGVVGINAVRVYDPTKQILDNDPECAFLRRFLPELRSASPPSATPRRPARLRPRSRRSFVPPRRQFRVPSPGLRRYGLP